VCVMKAIYLITLIFLIQESSSLEGDLSLKEE
jgi:hypothetical protein